jgi:hypothetical protein
MNDTGPHLGKSKQNQEISEFKIIDDRDFRPQTCTNGLVFRECKHIKNIFEDVYFTKNSFHTTLTITGRGINLSSFGD